MQHASNTFNYTEMLVCKTVLLVPYTLLCCLVHLLHRYLDVGVGDVNRMVAWHPYFSPASSPIIIEALKRRKGIKDIRLTVTGVAPGVRCIACSPVS